MEEIWLDIEGYEGKYMVSNLGRVKSLNYCNSNKERIMSLGNNGNGYLYASLQINHKRKNIYVHRLVAKSFIPNPNKFPVINHKDENKQNNCVDNLEWCTQKFNTRYSSARKVGCFKDNKLVKVYNALIDVVKDGFYHQAVWKCCNGKYKSSGGYQWRYID